MKEDHPDVNFGKTGVLLVNLARQTPQGISENI